MNWESTRPRSRSRIRWQDEVREHGRIVGGEDWQEKVYNREEWKKLPRMAMKSSNSARGNGMNKSPGWALKNYFLKQPIYPLRITL
jgi:hypothetical protein